MQPDSTPTEDPVLPVKSIDPNQDISERVSENVRDQIGPSRYFVTDRLGNDDSSWENVFDRVSRNIALAELAHHGDALWEGVGEDRPLGPSVMPEISASDDLIESLPSEVREHYNEVRSDFFDVMAELRFIPNTPTLTSAGAELQQLSACFVSSPNDSMESIFDTNKEWGLIEKSGGGMGGCFHHLRPKGAPVGSTGGVSSGPMEFIKLFDATGQTIKQGGSRSGAQMAVMHVHHPDVGRFAVSKRGEDSLTCFNISVGVSDDFVGAVETDEMYTFEDPETGTLGLDAEPFEVVPETAHFYSPKFEDSWNDEYDSPGIGFDGKTVEENFWRDYYPSMSDPSRFDRYRDRIGLEPGQPMELPARFIWELIIDGAYNNGEPGIIHLDRVNDEHSFDVEQRPQYFIDATNPCGEQPLVNYESCNLGHVNLSLMVDEDRPLWDTFFNSHTTGPGREDISNHVSAYLDHVLDEDLLDETVRTGTRFLDNVITMSDFPIDEIDNQVGRMRKIGLGVMGFHQLLLQCGIEYGSPISVEMGRQIMERIDKIATDESHQLAKDRGVFPAWNDSKWSKPDKYSKWFKKHGYEFAFNWRRGYPIRNHNVTTVAPTGTTGRIGNTSLSIEPIYNVAFFSNVSNDIQGDEYLVDFDDYFIRTLEANNIDVDVVRDEAVELMSNNEFDGPGSLDTIPDEIATLFVTAGDVDPESHVDILTAFQQSVDSSISKTCNLPHDSTHNDVDRIYRRALRDGAKSVTVYRDGSRDEQVLTTRVDNGLENDETTIHWLVEQLSTEMAHDVVSELSIEDDLQDVSLEKTCEECGSGRLDLSEGCPVCHECGWSPCK